MGSDQGCVLRVLMTLDRKPPLWAKMDYQIRTPYRRAAAGSCCTYRFGVSSIYRRNRLLWNAFTHSPPWIVRPTPSRFVGRSAGM
jgi:hypothetical protein